MYDYKDNLGRIKEILNIFPLYTLPYNEDVPFQLNSDHS